MANYVNKSNIYSVIIKNGYEFFKLEILEYCDKKEIHIREQYYIDILKPKYNILKFVGSSLGFKHSEATINTMRINKTKEKKSFF